MVEHDPLGRAQGISVAAFIFQITALVENEGISRGRFDAKMKRGGRICQDHFSHSDFFFEWDCASRHLGRFDGFEGLAPACHRASQE